MNKYEKAMMFRPMLMKVLFVVVAVLNLALPMKVEKDWYLDLFQLVMVGIWLYATVCALGYFCIPTNVVQGDMELYEVRTPILPWVFVRLSEGGFRWAFSLTTFNWKFFGIALLGDVIFLFFLLMDKSNYGYAKSIED